MLGKRVFMNGGGIILGNGFDVAHETSRFVADNSAAGYEAHQWQGLWRLSHQILHHSLLSEKD